jgi:hypothetical protein
MPPFRTVQCAISSHSDLLAHHLAGVPNPRKARQVICPNMTPMTLYIVLILGRVEQSKALNYYLVLQISAIVMAWYRLQGLAVYIGIITNPNLCIAVLYTSLGAKLNSEHKV